MSRTRRLTPPLLLLIHLTLLASCRPSDRLAPTPTKTPVPVVTGGEADATPAPFHTPTPDVIAAGPDSYPPGTNPLTGLPVDDPKSLDRRPLAIVVSNSPPDFTRPQAGLGSADIVYEYFAEGHVTRYTAIFWTNTPELVGSVRSCRPIMLEITLMYDALWACSGSSSGVAELLAESPNIRWLINGQHYGEPYLRRIFDENIAVVPEAPHNLFAVPSAIWDWAEEKGYNDPPDLRGMAFHSQPPAGGVVATALEVDYKGAGFTPRWEYDAASGTYLRFDEGKPYVDNLTKEQLAFENVIVVASQEIITDIVEDPSGATALVQQIWGNGPLTVFRDGMRYEGTWQRPTRDDILTFQDLNGNPMLLKPGKTWVHVIDLQVERLTVEP